MPFTPKDWRSANTPTGGGDESTNLDAEALEDLEIRVTDYADDITGTFTADLDDTNTTLAATNSTLSTATANITTLKASPLNVKASPYNAVGNGVTDDTYAIQSALTQAYNNGGGAVYVPAGTYKITSPLVAYQPVSLVGDGSYSTIFKLMHSTAKVMFDGDTHGGRGGISGGFRINMYETALLGFHGYHIVNRSFEDIRVDSPAAQGTAMLLEDCQNCDFDGTDMEGKGGGEGPAGTRGLVFDKGASGNNFYGFRANEFMGPHVSYRQTDEAVGSGTNAPRHNWLWGVMIERTTTRTDNNCTPYIIYHRAGADNGICGGNISATTDDADPGPGVDQIICKHDNQGDGPENMTSTRPVYRDLKINGEVWTTTTTINNVGGYTLPVATLTVADTTNFDTYGTLTINSQTVTYTGKTGTTFTGCSGGTGSVSNGATVSAVVRRSIPFEVLGSYHYGTTESCSIGNVRYGWKFDNQGSHFWRERGNFVDTVAQARYTGTDTYMRANYMSTSSGTLDTQRGQTSWFYAHGTADLTKVNPYVETNYEVTVEFGGTRTVKHLASGGNIELSGDTDWVATAGDMLYLKHDGAGTFHEQSRVIKS